jgi:hypothetical protein
MKLGERRRRRKARPRPCATSLPSSRLDPRRFRSGRRDGARRSRRRRHRGRKLAGRTIHRGGSAPGHARALVLGPPVVHDAVPRAISPSGTRAKLASALRFAVPRLKQSRACTLRQSASRRKAHPPADLRRRPRTPWRCAVGRSGPMGAAVRRAAKSFHSIGASNARQSETPEGPGRGATEGRPRSARATPPPRRANAIAFAAANTRQARCVNEHRLGLRRRSPPFAAAHWITPRRGPGTAAGARG